MPGIIRQLLLPVLLGLAVRYTCGFPPSLHRGTRFACVAPSPTGCIRPHRVGCCAATHHLASTETASTDLRILPNGIRLIVRERHAAALIAVDIWVRAGSGREASDESGAAHFLEHLIFKGTPTRKPGEIDAAIEDLGATLSAGTTRDATHFFTTVATSYFPTVLDVLADALQNAALSPTEMEHERSVILDEMARGRNDVEKQALNLLFEKLYPHHAYFNPILGHTDSLRQISRETIAAFYHRWYLPNDTTIVIVGDITPDAAESQVAHAFGGWTSRDRPATGPDHTPGAAVPLPAVSQSGRTAALAVGYRIAASDRLSDLCAADVLATLLADRGEGRLWKAVGSLGPTNGGTVRRSETLGPVHEIDVQFTPLRDSAVFALYAAVDGSHIEAIQRVFSAELSRLQREGISAEEMDYAKRRVLGAYLFDTETFAGQARMLGLYDVIHDYHDAIDYADTIRKLTAADIAAFAQRTFDPARQAEVILLPQANR